MTPEPVLSVPDPVPPESSRTGVMLSVSNPVLSSLWNWFWNQFYVKLWEQVLSQIHFHVKPDLLKLVTLLDICANCGSYLSNFGLGPELILAQIQFQVKPDLPNSVTLLYICANG